MKKSAQKHSQAENIQPSPGEMAHSQEVNRRAYELWEAAGGEHGDDLRHWFEAEREVTARTAYAR